MAGLAQKSSILNNMEALALGSYYIGSSYRWYRFSHETSHKQLAVVGIFPNRNRLLYFARNRFPHSL